jgi:hypothetical protein
VSLDTGPSPPVRGGGEPAATDAGADVTAPPAEPSVEREAPGLRRLALACVVLTALPIVVAAVRAVAGDWVAVGDNAFFAIRSRDVLTEHHPWLGTWTSVSLSVGFDVNNPGPLLFDALALPVKIAGDAGLAVGTALINLAAVAGMALVARRQAGARGVVAAMLAAAGLAWTMGSALLIDPWQPHSLLLPVLCFLMLVWALACGDLAMLPWAVGLASFVVQTHVGYALIVPLLGAWGVGALALRLWRERRDDAEAGGERRRQVVRIVGVSVLVAAVCWAQSLVEQVFVSGRGNLSRLASAATADKTTTIGFEQAYRFVAEIVALPPFWGRPSMEKAFLLYTPLPSERSSTLGLALVALALVAGVVVARRRADRPGAMAAATGLVMMVVAAGAATTMPIGVMGVGPHHVRWLWPFAVFLTFAVVLALVTAPGRDRLARAGLGLAAAATLVLGVAALPAYNPHTGPSYDSDAMPAIRTILPQLSELRDEEAVLFDVRSIRFAEPFSIAVMSELQRLGVAWYVNESIMARQLGDTRSWRGERASVRLFVVEGDPARETPPGARRIAFADGLAPGEAEELAGLKDDLLPMITSGGLTVNGVALPPEVLGPNSEFPTGTASSADLRRMVDFVLADQFEAPARWVEPLRRFAELQRKADRLTVGVFIEPLEAE